VRSSIFLSATDGNTRQKMRKDRVNQKDQTYIHIILHLTTAQYTSSPRYFQKIHQDKQNPGPEATLKKFKS
jgi:hypothetical protein